MKTTNNIGKAKILRSLIGLFLIILSSAQTRGALISDFNDGVADWDYNQCRGACLFESGGQLVASGNIPAKVDCVTYNMSLVRWNRSLTVHEGEVLRFGVDLVEANPNDVMAFISYDAPGTGGGGYTLFKDEDEIWLGKYQWVDCGAYAPLFYEGVAISNEHVRLVLELTRIGSSLKLTTKVIDINDGDAVLFQRTVIDTASIDPTIPSFRGYTWSADAGPPVLNGTAVSVGVINAADTAQSGVRVVFDNHFYERQPLITIDRIAENAVRLSWPASFQGWQVLGAPAVVGPWSTLSEPVLQQDGAYWMTLPAPLSSSFRAFRLRAPASP